jgi:uncharacterized protein (TIGR03437 family)
VFLCCAETVPLAVTAIELFYAWKKEMPRNLHYSFITFLALFLGLSRIAPAAVPDRITRPVDVNRTATLSGNLSRRAQAQFDQGAVDPAMPMPYIVLLIQPAEAQQADLAQLLAGQQNPSSAFYHQWLTPEEFASRFGLSSADHSKVVAWLTSSGLTVKQSARGRNWIAFSGAAGQISAVLHTPIHRFQVDGETHYSNTAEPAVPEALAGVIGGFLGLNDFHPRSMISRIAPAYTSGTSHYLAPHDWATIYDVSPLYQAGFNGTGQSIAVVGESDVEITDIRNFRSRFSLPANDPKMVLYSGTDPGYNGAQAEGDLDLEWAGAIAPNATIYYVYGEDALAAMIYAIDQNLAPVVTVSYGGCETEFSLNWEVILQQANAQGITVLNSSGDFGAAGCELGDMPFAENGIAVDFPAALPEVTGVGGTQFAEGAGTYWATTNSSGDSSALSYIPEAVWNESSAEGLAAGGGGASLFYPKPLWQTGSGVLADNAREVPDVAFSSAIHDGYLVVYEGQSVVLGGTSCSSPSFAGVVSLLNQYQVSKGYQASAGLGNINPQLYRLAQNAPSVFHDVTAGSNAVNCAQGTADCATGSFGYPAGTGYDRASGLGSVDVNNLVTQWNSQASAVTVSLFVNAATATLNATVGMTATVVPATPSAAVPTGAVSFSVGDIPLGTSTLRAVNGQQEADLFFPAYLFGATGSFTITAQYAGDTVFSGGGTTQTIRITAPRGAAAIVPTAPNTVGAASPDAQGLSWSTTLTLNELAGVSAIVTGFSINGAAQSLPQYFPAPTLAARGTLSTTVVQRDLTVPSKQTFGFTGEDADGNTWSRQIAVNYMPLTPGSVPIISATPLVIAQNPKADPSCQWPIQLNIDEAGGNEYLELTNLMVGSVDWSSQIPALFGTVRLAPWADLQATICLGGNVTPPATETIQTTVSGLAQQIVVSLTGPVASPTQLSVSPASLVMGSAASTLAINLADPHALWSASIFPANPTTSWLGLSQFSGAGPAQVTLTANPQGLEPGAYRASLVIQSPSAVPQTVTVPILYVRGSAAGTAISSIANPATYSSSVSPGMVIAVFGSNLAKTTDTASGDPLPYSLDGVSAAVNGIAAPILYVSPTQVNIQIPYEAGAGQAVLGVNNSGQVAGFQLPILAAAPGIFADANGNLMPSATIVRGTSATLYLAGAGEVYYPIDTGYVPTVAAQAALYGPALPLSVTVGGVPVFVQSANLSVNALGLMQVKFTVPSSAAAGVLPVVVIVNGVASPPVNVTVQ